MRAAAYLRSTKDRNDVSPAAQLHKLREVAAARSLTIVETYEDAVRRGSTDDRPAFQRLIADIKRRDRGWTYLLMHDTSRLARGRYIAQAFRHQCRKHGVTLIIASIPETDPVSAVILESMLEAMDEVNSIMSRDKGLAGMAENIRRGWRAGGRAPWGYQLKHEPTGAIRDGKPVTKSHLVVSHEASTVTAYLQARAAGVPRARAAAGLGRKSTTLVDVEWNALTYAGHTIWNRHTDKKQRGQGKSKRRPREEWQIQRDTHQALITEAQAEQIIAQLEASHVGAAISRARRSQSMFLLSEILVTPDGRRWEGSGSHYRLRPGRWISAQLLERGVLAQLRSDLRSDSFIEQLLDRPSLQPTANAAKPVHEEIARLARQKAKAARLAIEDGGDAYIPLVGELARRIEALEREAVALAAEDEANREMQKLTSADVKRTLLAFDDDRALISLLQEVALDPDTLQVDMTYRASMASPRRSGRWPEPLGAVTSSFRLRAA
ncbi:MAG: hypothetical protein RLZZ200_1124 [Pseudomonadota bacterium]|jgi:DNA invertase Pin-like site-specific DNA recombinase